MELHYTVYPACDVITRSAVLLNEGDTVQVERLMSMQLDMPFGGAAVTSFHGAWGREMNRHTAALPVGKLVLESRTGCSSNRVNPFFMVHSPDANEASGSVYGFNLIYSGNHYAAAEVNAYGKTRIVSGIQPEGFRWLLEKDGRFETPEAVMTYSENGFTGQSQNMHRFVRRHIVRGVWRDRPRPVLLNSWEACYFNINEKSLVSMARSAKDLGVELLVMDDGWFGERDNDRCSLGDFDIQRQPLCRRRGQRLRQDAYRLRYSARGLAVRHLGRAGDGQHRQPPLPQAPRLGDGDPRQAPFGGQNTARARPR